MGALVLLVYFAIPSAAAQAGPGDVGTLTVEVDNVGAQPPTFDVIVRSARCGVDTRSAIVPPATSTVFADLPVVDPTGELECRYETLIDDVAGWRDELALREPSFGIVRFNTGPSPTATAQFKMFRQQPNDDLADAISIAGAPASATVSYFAGGSRETNEPTCLVNSPPQRSVWYRWNPASDGAYSFDVAGGWPTVEIFTSPVSDPAPADLVRASPVEGCGYLNTTLTASAAETYWIRLDTYNPSDGMQVPATLTITGGGQGPFVDHQLPTTIEAEDFDYGPEGDAYNEVDDAGENGANVGSAADYRPTEVDIYATQGANAPGHVVGHTRDGEFLEYTTSSGVTQSLQIDAVVATALTNPGSLRLDVNGVEVATVAVDDTGGWWNFATVSFGEHRFAGNRDHVIRITWLANASGQVPKINIDRLELTAPAPGSCERFDYAVSVEAETGRTDGSIVVAANADARGDMVITADPALRNRYTLGPTHYVDYCVTATVARDYVMSAKVRAPDASSDSVWIQIDDEEPVLWHMGAVGIQNLLTYTPVIDSRTVAQWTFRLDEGDHRVRFYHREAGVQLDYWQIFPAPDFVPPAPSPSACSFNLGIDAEAGDISGQMLIGDDPMAARAGYIEIDPTLRLNYANPSTDHFVTHCVTIPAAGSYRFVARALTPDSGSDSIMLDIDGAGIETWHMPRATSWTSLTKPGSYTLPAGDIAVVIYGRESGTLLDEFSLVAE